MLVLVSYCVAVEHTQYPGPQLSRFPHQGSMLDAASKARLLAVYLCPTSAINWAGTLSDLEMFLNPI